MFEGLNRREWSVVEQWLPRDAPPRGLTGLAEVARGGVLWLIVAAGLTFRPGRCRAGARDAAVAVVVVSALAHLVGRVLHRRRPAASGVAAYEALPHKPTSPSLPSAHAAVTAAFTTALTRRTGAAGLAVAPVAVLVAYSRIRTRAHWPTDVAAGLGQGIVVGEIVHRVMTRHQVTSHRRLAAT
jgi:membrane-associated phospholipid phosphatase